MHTCGQLQEEAKSKPQSTSSITLQILDFVWQFLVLMHACVRLQKKRQRSTKSTQKLCTSEQVYFRGATDIMYVWY